MSFAAHFRVTASLAAGLFLLASCGTRTNNQLGVALIEDEGGSKAVRLLEIAMADTAAEYQFADVPGEGGLIGTLLVGSRPGFLARALVRFDAASFPAAGTVLDSAAVEWTLREGIGSTPPLLVRLHQVAGEWSEATTDSASFPFLATAFDSMSVPFPGPSPDTLRIAVGAVAQAWVDDPAMNFGIALTPADGQDSEIEFGAREAGAVTRLLLYTTVGGEAVTTTILPSADTFVLETTLAFVSPLGAARRLTLARGLPARALLKFSWPDPGARATINRAELILHVDGAASLTNGFAVGVQRVLAEPWTADSTQADPLLYGVSTILATSDSVVFAMTGIVDALLAADNHGLQIRATEERTDTDVLRLHGPDTEVPGKAPRLRIWYTPGAGAEEQP